MAKKVKKKKKKKERKEKNLLDGHAWKTIVLLLFWAQHRSNPPRSAKHADKFNTRDTQPRRSFVVITTLCIYCTRGQSHSLLPFTAVYHHATHTHTHTYTYTQDTNMYVTTRKPHAPPRLVSSPLNLSCFETNTPLFPSCSRLASSPQLRESIQELSEQLSSESHRCCSPCQVENVRVRTGYDVSISRAIIDRSINTYSLQRMPSLSKYNCPVHCRGDTPRNYPRVSLAIPVLKSSISWLCPRKRTSVDIRNTCYA